MLASLSTAILVLLIQFCFKCYALPPFKIKKLEAAIDHLSGEEAERSPTSAADQTYYRSLVPYVSNTYCPDIQAGMKFSDDATILWRGGDGIDEQIVYIAHSPSLGIVVAYEGTNKTSLDSIDHDLRFIPDSPFPEFAWLGDGVKIAKSVQESWTDSADQVYEQVMLAMRQFKKAEIIVTGHSLGASIALLEGLRLSHRLQKDIALVLFGMPRTGNKKFADAVDTLLPRQRHIVFHRDVVPHFPLRLGGFHHPSGEVFIANDEGTRIYDCKGQENRQCADGVHLYEIPDHSGPYFGLTLDVCSAK